MKKYFIIIILLVGLQSCQSDNTDNYEMNVLVEIFDDLIEEMGVLSGLEIPPPPTPNLENNAIGYDTVTYNREIDEIEKRNKKMRDTTVVLAIVDTLSAYHDKKLDEEHIRKQLPNPEYMEALYAMDNPSIISRPLDLSKIGNRERIILRSSSEFPGGIKIWERENYDFLLSGLLRISRIYFNKEKQYGLLYCSYTYGRLGGEGVIICIHKTNSKWGIEKIISLWIA